MGKLTSKKVKVVGQQEYINATTGEVESFNVTRIEDRDFDFHKIWLRNFVSTLDIVGNKKTRLCMWIVENIDKNNHLIGTLRSIAERSGTSLETVRVTMKVLQDADFLRRVQMGLYIVNPDVVFQGDHKARLNLLNQYSTVEQVELTDQEKLEHIESSIRRLSKEAEALRKRLESKDNSAA